MLRKISIKNIIFYIKKSSRLMHDSIECFNLIILSSKYCICFYVKGIIILLGLTSNAPFVTIKRSTGNFREREREFHILMTFFQGIICLILSLDNLRRHYIKEITDYSSSRFLLIIFITLLKAFFTSLRRARISTLVFEFRPRNFLAALRRSKIWD